MQIDTKESKQGSCMQQPRQRAEVRMGARLGDSGNGVGKTRDRRSCIGALHVAGRAVS